jgi:tetratricopeptide (TPR) repeat protein
MWRKAFSVIVVGFLFSANAIGQETYNAHLSQAKSLITQQKYADAVNEAQRAIALDGQRWEAYVIAAKGYSSQQLYDDAIGMLQTALTRAPEDKKALIRDAIADCRKRLNQENSSSSPGGSPASKTAPTMGSAVPAPTQAEIVLWKSIENSNNPSDFEAYLAQYPQGTFVVLAQRHLAASQQQQTELIAQTEQQRRTQQQALVAKSSWTDPTGTMWEKPDGEVPAMHFTEAVEYCAQFRSLGYTDWRLPTAEELHRISNKRSDGCSTKIGGGSVDNRNSCGFWTGSDGKKQGQHVVIRYGEQESFGSGWKSGVLCVRNTN